jgi:hypothetical protein
MGLGAVPERWLLCGVAINCLRGIALGVSICMKDCEVIDKEGVFPLSPSSPPWGVTRMSSLEIKEY